MSIKKKLDELLEHDFDGIREYDNDLPGWWKALFYATIVFAVVYLMHYHVLGTGDLQRAEYLKEMNPGYSSEYTDLGGGLVTPYHSPFFASQENLTPRVRAELRKLVDVSFEEHLMRAMAKAGPEELAKLERDFPDVYKKFVTGGVPVPGTGTGEMTTAPAITEPLTSKSDLAAGKAIFRSKCFTCHGKQGEGGIGPNLTDEYWIHGGTIADIVHVVRKGVPAKGMIAWERTLSPDEINQVASFVFVSLRGTNPPNAKAPQGEKAAASPANKGQE